MSTISQEIRPRNSHPENSGQKNFCPPPTVYTPSSSTFPKNLSSLPPTRRSRPARALPTPWTSRQPPDGEGRSRSSAGKGPGRAPDRYKIVPAASRRWTASAARRFSQELGQLVLWGHSHFENSWTNLSGFKLAIRQDRRSRPPGWRDCFVHTL